MQLRAQLTKRKISILILSVLNAIFLLWLTFFLLSIPYVLPDEYVLVRYSSVTKNLILGLEEKPDTNRFLFVNVAWDKVLADKPDPALPEYIIGNQPITDRAKLTGLLRLLKRNPNHKFIVFDIFFKGKTPDDSAMVALINELPNVLVSYHRDAEDKPELPDLDIKPLGLSDIEKIDDKCLKFKIYFNDSLKTTPLLIYENIHKKPFHEGSWFYYLGNKPVLNSFILDYRIRNYDYTQGRYSKVYLGEWINQAYRIYPELNLDDFDFDDLEFEEEPAGVDENTDESSNELNVEEASFVQVPEEEFPLEDQDMLISEDSLEDAGFGLENEFVENLFNEYDLKFLDQEYAENYIYGLTKDRIIFVGDFEDRDMHETIYGDTPGPIILLDAFLALEEGDNVITVQFVIFLIFFFALISYITFNYRTIHGPLLQRLTHRNQATFFESLTVFLVYFASVSVLSFFLFNIHIGVLVLAFYMYVVDKVKVFIVRRIDKRKLNVKLEKYK